MKKAENAFEDDAEHIYAAVKATQLLFYNKDAYYDLQEQLGLFHRYDKESVKNIIINEGLLYAVKSYLDIDDISKLEPDLREYWDDAQTKIAEFEKSMVEKGYEPAYLIGNRNNGFAIISDPLEGKYEEIPVYKLPTEAQEKIKEIDNILLKIINYVGLDESEFGDKYENGGKIDEKNDDDCYMTNLDAWWYNLSEDVRKYLFEDGEHDVDWDVRESDDIWSKLTIDRKKEIKKAVIETGNETQVKYALNLLNADRYGITLAKGGSIDKLYKVTYQNKWIPEEKGYFNAKNHLEAINKVDSNVERITNDRFREIETTGEFYYVEDEQKGGKTFIFEVKKTDKFAKGGQVDNDGYYVHISYTQKIGENTYTVRKRFVSKFDDSGIRNWAIFNNGNHIDNASSLQEAKDLINGGTYL